MSLELTSQTKSITKGSLVDAQLDKTDSTSKSERAGTQKQSSRTDINRTSTTNQSGNKQTNSASNSQSARQTEQVQTRSGVTIERVNLGFRLTFSIPITSIIPTNCS